jgi:hypothetical protein
MSISGRLRGPLVSLAAPTWSSSGPGTLIGKATVQDPREIIGVVGVEGSLRDRLWPEHQPYTDLGRYIRRYLVKRWRSGRQFRKLAFDTCMCGFQNLTRCRSGFYSQRQRWRPNADWMALRPRKGLNIRPRRSGHERTARIKTPRPTTMGCHRGDRGWGRLADQFFRIPRSGWCPRQPFGNCCRHRDRAAECRA